MSIVTGIATASGISPLLNAPRETNPDQRPNALQQAQQAGAAARETGRAVTNAISARPVIGVARGASVSQSEDTKSSSDVRYMRFVKALEIVRTGPGAEALDDQPMAGIADDIEENFLIDDGIPREVEPLLPERSVLIKPDVDLMKSPVLDLATEATEAGLDEAAPPEAFEETSTAPEENLKPSQAEATPADRDAPQERDTSTRDPEPSAKDDTERMTERQITPPVAPELREETLPKESETKQNADN